MRAIVLSGGGSRGAYEVGVLKRWMYEEGREYDILVGTSVGAINVVGLAHVKKGDPRGAYKHLEGIWDRVNNGKVRKKWLLRWLAAIWRPSLYNSEPLREWIQEEVDVSAVAASDRIVRVGAVSETTGCEYVATESDPLLPEVTYSSAAFPLAFKPGKFNDEEWVDWGIRHVTPIGEAVKLGADVIDVITTFNIDEPLDHWKPRYRAVAARGIRDLDIMVNEIMRGDFRAVGDRNEIAKLGGKYRHVELNVQMPSLGKPIKYDSLDFSAENVKEGREYGYADSAP